MRFSIITPCYKSVKTLRRTYESLLKQTNNDFEWILIDDMSPDGGQTKDLILQIKDEAPFKVKYKFLDENHFGSKSTYEACLIAEGEYACILDHDDELTFNALTIVDRYIELYQIDSKKNLAGVCGRCVDENRSFIGRKFKKDCFISNEGSVRFKMHIYFELFQFTKIKILRDSFEKIKPGYTNGYCWADISKGYDYLYVNDVLRVYDTFNPLAYSNNKGAILSYPKNKADNLKYILECYRDFLWCDV
ncbi:glycosyltransferase family 2 protein, partial [Vibrio cidicii]|uniref:glycosyltransferase family 2 protein n=1 Tax=Vibrio cidicii TaxID=1763883 RepID=UPI0018C33AA2